jgi:hypothetical protein
MMPATTIIISIERPPADVHAFVAHPPNLPRWAAGLARAVPQDREGWIAESPQGAVRVRFAPPNALGVADHHVTVSPGRDVDVPVRVVSNGEGSEVLITVFRQPEMTETQYREDLGLVRADLERLKRVLEATR